MNEPKFQNKYRIDSARLAGYDYGTNGTYFVTVCTGEKANYFGDIVTVNDEVIISPSLVGQRVIDGWFSTPEFSPANSKLKTSV